LFEFEFQINHELNGIEDLLRGMYAVYKSGRGKEMKKYITSIWRSCITT
jgi:hypothetical protein